MPYTNLKYQPSFVITSEVLTLYSYLLTFGVFKKNFYINKNYIWPLFQFLYSTDQSNINVYLYVAYNYPSLLTNVVMWHVTSTVFCMKACTVYRLYVLPWISKENADGVVMCRPHSWRGVRFMRKYLQIHCALRRRLRFPVKHEFIPSFIPSYSKYLNYLTWERTIFRT